VKKGDHLVAFFVDEIWINVFLSYSYRYPLRFSMSFPLKLRHKIDRNFFYPLGYFSRIWQWH